MLQTLLKYVEYEQSYALFYGGGQTKIKSPNNREIIYFIHPKIPALCQLLL